MRSQCVTEIALPLGLPDYSTVLEDNKETHAYEQAQSQNRHMPDGLREAAAATSLDGLGHQGGLFISTSTFALHKVCFKRKKYIRRTVSSPKLFLPLTLLWFQSNQP